MTKKDFELIARVLRASALVLNGEPAKEQLRAEAFADALATTNPRFDRARFIAAATGRDAA